MKNVKQSSPESHDFHTKVKASIGNRGTLHGMAKKNTGAAINGKNSHSRGRTAGAPANSYSPSSVGSGFKGNKAGMGPGYNAANC